MALSPTYRADWLREDLLLVLNGINEARICIAAGDMRGAELALRIEAAPLLARVIAAPAIPELADLLAERKADAKEAA